MKLAVFSDIHDNLTRWQEAAQIIKAEKIKVGICCGDVTSWETLNEIAKHFDKLYLAFGNGDWQIARDPKKVPKNVKAFEHFGAFELEGSKIAIVHNPAMLDQIAASSQYDVIFYGHTHTPWEKQADGTKFVNPGEIAGHFGPPSFCLFDLNTMNGTLKILK